ncbi:hypothetical protein F5Y10DRAFT_249000 [Nemania abortiva]|nr:hypothetical protein F5Y10DRAFT_249000 [Nemania abortiva]
MIISYLSSAMELSELDHTGNGTSYRNFISFRQQSNPCIAELSQFLDNRYLPKDACRVYAMDCVPKSREEDQPRGFEEVQIDDLHLFLRPPLPAGQGRVLIVEDIHPSIIETLGIALDIDPAFFADYIMTKYDEIEKSPAPPSIALVPSHLVSQEDRLTIHFQKIVDLGSEGTFLDSPWTLQTRTNVPRSVRRLSPISGRQLGIVRGCYSILRKPFSQGWIGLILMDSTTPDVSCGSDPVRLSTLHNGPEDFRTPIPFSTFKSLRCRTPPTTPISSVSMFQDFLSEPLRTCKKDHPPVLDLAYYPMRIIVGEWMLYCQVMSRYLKHYEYSFKNIESVLQGGKDDITELQKWRHRALQSRVKIRSTKQFITHRLAKDETGIDHSLWDLVLKDLDHLSTEIGGYGESLERTIPVVTSVLQLLDSRRSIEEAVNWSTCAGTVAALSSGSHLEFQSDGNLVLYFSGGISFNSGFSDPSLPCSNPCNCLLVLQGDGNLVTVSRIDLKERKTYWRGRESTDI